eukprot:2704621-Alexandrium_andersonii.AAC.1
MLCEHVAALHADRRRTANVRGTDEASHCKHPQSGHDSGEGQHEEEQLREDRGARRKVCRGALR